MTTVTGQTRRASGGRAIEANAVASDTQLAPLFRNGSFLLLWVGQFVSQMGDRLAALAFPWYNTLRTYVNAMAAH